MKIYDYPAFPNPARVRIALHEKGVFDQIEFVTIDVPAGEHKSARFAARNPSTAVPVLELECGTFISECTAITEYIDNAFDGPRLTGTTAKEKATIHMMQRRSEQMVMDAVGSYFHHATSGLGPDIESYQNAEWGRHQQNIAKKGFEYFNEVLKDRRYVATGDFSMADITLYCGLGFADFVKVDVPASLEHLHQWRSQVAERESVKAAAAG